MAFGLEQHVDYIINTDELDGMKYRKPNEKAFVLIKEYFGVEYNEMCYVDDITRKDFIAPEKLGIGAI